MTAETGLKYNESATYKRDQLSKNFYRYLFILILAVSFFLRYKLVFEDGQLFNPDENRYIWSRVVAQEIYKHNFTKAMTTLTAEAEHQGFKFLGVLPALIEVKRWGQNLHFPALFFCLFSLFNLALVGLLALRLGADEKEAALATFAAACSSALFYYSSHLFPYDAAMFFGLLALYIGVQKQPKIRTSIFVGFFGFLTFFTYNGYWSLAGLAFAVHIFIDFKNNKRIFFKSVFAGIGFFASLFLFVWMDNSFGNDLLGNYSAFSETVQSGVFSEGWVFPFQYLWAAENWLYILWLVSIGYAIFSLSNNPPQRTILYLGSIVFVYGCLFISSVVLQKFVVYGRLVRQVVPFLALGSSYGLRILADNKNWRRSAFYIFLVFMVIQTGFNFRRSFMITYPEVFSKQAQLLYPDFKPPKNMMYFYTPDVVDAGPYKAYYIKYITPYSTIEIPSSESIIVLSAEHPLSSFPPFRYEDGFTPEERAKFPEVFSTMMVVEP